MPITADSFPFPSIARPAIHEKLINIASNNTGTLSINLIANYTFCTTKVNNIPHTNVAIPKKTSCPLSTMYTATRARVIKIGKKVNSIRSLSRRITSSRRKRKTIRICRSYPRNITPSRAGFTTYSKRVDFYFQNSTGRID